MSWYTKVAWTEGLFLRPHHFQQNDRYHRTSPRNPGTPRDAISLGLRHAGDRSRSRPAEQVRLAARSRSDAGRHAVRRSGRQPAASADRGAGAASQQIVWLTMPMASATCAKSTTREAESAAATSRHRNLHRFHLRAADRGRDRHRVSAAELRNSQDRQAGLYRPRHRPHPRSSRQAHRVRRKICAAGPVCAERIRSSTAGSIASSAGSTTSSRNWRAMRPIPPRAAACRASTISCCSLLNRDIAVLKHFRSSSYVHPERLFEELLRLAGELATFATPERRAREYPAYDQDNLENVFGPCDARHAGLPQRPPRPARHPA